MTYPAWIDPDLYYQEPDENEIDETELGRLLDAENDQRIDEMRGK